jgi:multisubunit Na+/H+ antiporter MnhE subunit
VKPTLAIASLAGLYLAMIGRVHPGDVVVAIVLGGVVALATSNRIRERPTASLPTLAVAAVQFGAAVGFQIARGALSFARVLLSRARWRRAGLVEVPAGERSASGEALSGFVISLSPGTLLVDIDARGGRTIVSAIDGSDPDALRAEIRHFYERFQRPLVP